MTVENKLPIKMQKAARYSLNGGRGIKGIIFVWVGEGDRFMGHRLENLDFSYTENTNLLFF